MCGFAGFVDFKRRMAADARVRIAEAMASEISHRGPDDAGTHADPDLGLVLAFRRLSIVDLSAAGHQPMISGSGKSVIVFNGEIYNAEALRTELAAAGATFRGHSDTEVLIEALERWGVRRTLPRLAGMFAIVFVDRSSGRITLVRDRIGKKPLYFALTNNTLLFGSQSKCFRAHPEFTPRVDKTSVSAFLRFGYVPAPRSIYDGVECLRPAEMIEIEDGRIKDRAPYWDLRAQAAVGRRQPLVAGDVDARDQLEALLDQAVAERKVADVPLGAFLSGGIDSSTVVALMQRRSDRPINTFSIGFNEADWDEFRYAAAVARHIGTDHHQLVVGPQDLLDAIPLLPEYFDEPFADPSAVPTYLLCSLTARHVKVALSGDGGDELLAGYIRYRLAEQIHASSRALPRPLRPAALWMLRRSPDALWNLLEPAMPKGFGTSPLSERISKLTRLLEQPIPEAIFQDLVGIWPAPVPALDASSYVDDAIWTGALADNVPPLGRRFQLIDALTYLPDDILVKVDRASMAVGLEARAPLLDHRLVEFTLSLPSNMLVRNGETKWLLRQVLYKHVPRTLIDRPKMGFSVPIGDWLRGPLRDWAEDLLDEQRMIGDGILDAQAVRATWAGHLSGAINAQNRLWCVLMFQAWHRRWMGN